jgi:hypothetical protein
MASLIPAEGKIVEIVVHYVWLPELNKKPSLLSRYGWREGPEASF